MPVKDGLPVVGESYLQGQNFSRVNFKDQWASHPTTEEREIRLDKLGVHTEPDTQLAWAIFRNSPEWQEKLTQQLYGKLTASEITIINEENFESKYKTGLNEFSLPAEYKNFYDRRRIVALDKEG